MASTTNNTFKRLRRIFASTVGIGALTFAIPALAVTYSDGTLDTSFDTDGMNTTEFGGTNAGAFALAIQADGKAVTLGGSLSGGKWDFALARFNTDGSIDTSFGTGGKVTTDIGSNSSDMGYAVAIQSNGKIIAAGTSTPNLNGDFAVVRYNSDGTLDSGFGTGGKVTTDIHTNSRDDVTSMVIQSDDKIIVAGQSSDGYSGSEDYTLVRYNTDGTLDNSFGTGGILTIGLPEAGRGGHGGNNDYLDSIGIQSDGKIVIAGQTTTAGNLHSFAVMRLKADGSADPSFGGANGGFVTTDLLPNTCNAGRDMVIQSDGKILVAGETVNCQIGPGFTQDFALVRYNTDGTLDNSFGTGGTVITDFNATSEDYMPSIALQSDGKIITCGDTRAAGSLAKSDFALIRYNTNGTLDTSFDSDGKVATDFGGGRDACESVVIQSDQKIVAAGFGTVGGITKLAVARYWTGVSQTTTTVAGSSTSSSGATAPSDKTILSLSLKDIVDEGSARPGASVTVYASGFTPQETVTVGVLGSKSSTKTATANASGSIKSKVTIPKSAKKSVTVYAYSQTSKHGYRDIVNITRSSNLPGTGTNSYPTLFVAVMLLASGVVVTMRRRRTNQ